MKATYNWLGLSNYIEALTDNSFLGTISNTFKYTIVAVLGSNVLALALALMLDGPIRGRNVLRSLFFIPNIMGIAVAVLEELRRRECLFLVTTHYPQVKTYAEKTDTVMSARMAFDQATLAPLYRLEMGKSGESCALQIAERLGMPPHLLARAGHEVYGTPLTAEEARSTMKVPPSRLQRMVERKPENDPAQKFHRGDSVVVLPEREGGIVYRPADENGDVVVQVKGEKRKVKHTRLQLRVAAAELYPPDYDFSILFDTVENRKSTRILNKRYDPNVKIVREKEDWEQTK